MYQVTTEQILSEIRAYRELEWKRKFCREHQLYREEGWREVEDIRCAPDPTDTDLGWPIEAMTVIWDTGYLTIELSALAKMPAAKRNKIYKLGGL